MKTYVYIAMSVFEDDEESQRKGLVGLLYFIGDNSLGFDGDLHSKMPKLVDWLPIRVAALHLCTDDRFLRVFNSLLVAAMIRGLRVRLRIHDGESQH